MSNAACTDTYKQEIVEKYFDMVYRLALARTKDKSAADDVCQDVFLKYINSDKEFESEEHIKAWLLKVTVNCSKSIFTSSWFKKTVPLEETIPADMPEEESDVYLAVMKLPEKYRTVIHLFYYEELSVAEISEALGINESTVKSQLSRGRGLLKESLKGEIEIV